MALPSPYPTPEKGLYTTSQMLFSTLCEKPTSLAYQDRKQSQDRPIIVKKT